MQCNKKKYIFWVKSVKIPSLKNIKCKSENNLKYYLLYFEFEFGIEFLNLLLFDVKTCFSMELWNLIFFFFGNKGQSRALLYIEFWQTWPCLIALESLIPLQISNTCNDPSSHTSFKLRILLFRRFKPRLARWRTIPMTYWFIPYQVATHSFYK